MDAKVQDAFKQVRQFAKYVDALALVCDQADALAQVDQRTAEAEARVAKLKVEADAIAAANASVKEVAEQFTLAARTEAEAIRKQVADDVAKAEEKAASIVEHAERRAQELSVAAEAKVKAAEEKAQAYAVDVEVKTKEINDLDAKIAKAQAQIARLLGS